MKLLIIGGGGREHAIIDKIAADNPDANLFCAPGNAGIARLATCVPISATDLNGLLTFAKSEGIDFTIVGPDDPLVIGVVDLFREAGLPIFGPTRRAAALEGSKAFSKQLMKKYDIPTAGSETFDDYSEALLYIQDHCYPLVVKADGLALGKGVTICDTSEEAQNALREMMLDQKYGASGSRVVIEDFLTGPEVSILSFCDGKTIVPMVSAQDHKRAYDGDEGPNTGGMGTFSPSVFYTPEIADRCLSEIIQPTLQALVQEGIEYKGILYFGLMLTPDGPKVIEYNSRFGDPEAQVVLPRLKSNLLDIMHACVNGTLDAVPIEWYDNASACVVLASGGYPSAYKTGYEISGLEMAQKNSPIRLFHAGTREQDGKCLTNGGRVLGVTAVAGSLPEAVKAAYEAASLVTFSGVHFRRDIGKLN